MDEVGEHALAGLIEEVDDDILTEVGERHFRLASELPDQVGPSLERGVVGDAARQHDRVVGREPR
jgi:hypothetical protein